jgi:hypothetical protein
MHQVRKISMSRHMPSPIKCWCPGPELNRYVSFETRDFKSRASASFATRAREGFKANISVETPVFSADVAGWSYCKRRRLSTEGTK